LIDNRFKRSKIFDDFTKEQQEKYFNLNYKKYIHHVDTLYYSVFLKDEFDERVLPGQLEKLFILFDDLKLQCEKEKSDVWFEANSGHVFRKRRFSIYEYCISLPQYYDIFFTRSLPNLRTPRVTVQLRSIGLWEQGEYSLVLESYNYISEILKIYGVEIEKTQENRIDFCYHTNSIQNPIRFFGDDCLSKNLFTSFRIYNKVGRKNGKELTVEYLSLGNRKSNNLFFRSYNKVREVIEENYKGFFLEFWFNCGLISYYDYWVYLYAYNKKSYSSIYKGMLKFYINFGSDENLKLKFKSFLDDESNSIDDFKKFSLFYLPAPTLVINIEFQTMRKFYYYADSFINTFPISTFLDIPQLLRIWRILDNRKIFLDYLTSSVVCFSKEDLKNEYLDFWKRLRSCKLDETIKVKYKRDYSKKFDLNNIISRFKGIMATYNIYKNNLDTSIEEDLSSLISVLNDNDYVNDDGSISIFDDSYNKIKDKKKKALVSLIKKHQEAFGQQ